MFPPSRLTDMHVCPMVTPGVPPIPHVGGPIIGPCEPTVLTGFLPQARVTDMAVCVGPPDIIVMGSATVLVGFLPCARIMDEYAHGGMNVLGEFTVLVGG
ncbi:MAG TPA: PAAR domain-containing protein [Bryobacteraceae bacterium]|nr:PAAR domain-containing protein [Bryobacteraceae bacterium]